MSGLEQSVNFDRAIDYYDATRGFPDGIAPKVGKFLADVAGLTSQSNLLEVGIGTGRIAVPVVPHVNSISGVDISSGMMKKLQEKPNTEHISLVEADAHDLPFASNSFDAVLITHVLHLVPQPQTILAEMQRVMKTNSVFIHCRNSYRNNGIMQEINNAWTAHTTTSSRSPKRWNAIDNVITDAGFTIEREDSYVYSYKNRLADYVHAIEQRLWSSTWFLDDETHRRGVAAVHAVIDDRLGGDVNALSDGEGTFVVQIYRFDK